MRKIHFTPTAVVQASRLGVSIEELHRMVLSSARITHAEGNRRYHDYVFMVEGGIVMTVKRLALPPASPPTPEQREVYYACGTCKDTQQMVVFDECLMCHGRGCDRCDEGLVRRQVPCPDCTPKRYIGVYDNRKY